MDFSRSKVALVVASTLAVTTVVTLGLAVRFDYRRRNDSVFRKKLERSAKKLEQKSQFGAESSKRELAQTLIRAISAILSEQPPVTVEQKEQYFMEQVALGEQLAARSPDFYVPSAVCFYKALRVYPSPADLADIYQKTQPPAVFALVMELIALESNLSRPADPRDRTDSALLEEIDQDEIVPSSSRGPASVSSDHDGSSPSSGSYVHVESEAVVMGEEVVAETVTVEVVELEAQAESSEETVVADDPPEVEEE